MSELRSRCGWSVWNRYTPTHVCGRRTVDGVHCAQHAKMSAKTDESNERALAAFLAVASHPGPSDD